MSYIDRLNKKSKEWKAAQVRTGFDIDKGNHVIEIEKVTIEESKAPFALGQCEIRVEGAILAGKCKGKIARQTIFPEQPEEERNGAVMPSGLSTLKTVLKATKIWDIKKNFPWEQAEKILGKMRGLTVNVYATGKSNTCYLKSLVDPDEMAMDSDDDVEDIDADEPSSDDDFDDDEEFPEP